jgi:hypothetical protein
MTQFSSTSLRVLLGCSIVLVALSLPVLVPSVIRYYSTSCTGTVLARESLVPAGSTSTVQVEHHLH